MSSACLHNQPESEPRQLSRAILLEQGLLDALLLAQRMAVYITACKDICCSAFQNKLSRTVRPLHATAQQAGTSIVGAGQVPGALPQLASSSPE